MMFMARLIWQAEQRKSRAEWSMVLELICVSGAQFEAAPSESIIKIAIDSDASANRFAPTMRSYSTQRGQRAIRPPTPTRKRSDATKVSSMVSPGTELKKFKGQQSLYCSDVCQRKAAGAKRQARKMPGISGKFTRYLSAPGPERLHRRCQRRPAHRRNFQQHLEIGKRGHVQHLLEIR